ncbi:hypothetical protein Bca101_017733 [Brassica carinata]
MEYALCEIIKIGTWVVRASGKWFVEPRLVKPFEIRQSNLGKFEVPVADHGSDFEKETRSSLHKLVGYWRRASDESKPEYI